MKVGDIVKVANHGIMFDEMIDCEGEIINIDGEYVTVRFTTIDCTKSKPDNIAFSHVDYKYSSRRLEVVNNG